MAKKLKELMKNLSEEQKKEIKEKAAEILSTIDSPIDWNKPITTRTDMSVELSVDWDDSSVSPDDGCVEIIMEYTYGSHTIWDKYCVDYHTGKCLNPHLSSDFDIVNSEDEMSGDELGNRLLRAVKEMDEMVKSMKNPTDDLNLPFEKAIEIVINGLEEKEMQRLLGKTVRESL